MVDFGLQECCVEDFFRKAVYTFLHFLTKNVKKTFPFLFPFSENFLALQNQLKSMLFS